MRLYEKKELDSKIKSYLIYFYLQGHYLTQKGVEVDYKFSGLTVQDEIKQRIVEMDVLYGSKANFILIQFAKKMLEQIKQLHTGVLINEIKQKGESIGEPWADIEERLIYTNTDVDKQWPNERKVAEAENYPYPYQIINWDWHLKKERDSAYASSIIYQIPNELDVNIKKQEIEFDANRVQLFRISLSANEKKLAAFKNSFSDELPFKDAYLIAFQQI